MATRGTVREEFEYEGSEQINQRPNDLNILRVDSIHKSVGRQLFQASMLLGYGMDRLVRPRTS